jgi:hypothetical protein
MITWSIDAMNCYPDVDGKKDVVFNVFWRCSGTDGNYNAFVYGSERISATSEFTPYELLTQDQVIGWVKTALGDKVALCEADVTKQIANLANPPIKTPALPW